MFYPAVMSALGKVVDNLRKQQQTASEPSWAKAAPFLRFTRNKMVAAGVPQLPPYISRPVTRSRRGACANISFGLAIFSSH